MASKPKTGPLVIGEHIEIDGGDGDQAFLDAARNLKLTRANWFPGEISWGAALLFVIDDGPLEGEFVALTSRTLAPLNEHLEAYGWASVLVHRITNPTDSFSGSDKEALPLAMAYVVRSE